MKPIQLFSYEDVYCIHLNRDNDLSLTLTKALQLATKLSLILLI